MFRKKSFKFSIITIAFILLFSIALGVVAFATEPAFDVKFTLENVVDNRNAELMQEFIATFTITPNPIPAERAEKTPKEIYLVVDTSGSMGFDLQGKARLSVAKQSAHNFLDSLKDDTNVKVGLIKYDNIATVRQELTTDFSKVRFAIDSLYADGGTNIGDGLRIAYHELVDKKKGNDKADKYVILLTDGEPTFHSYKSGYNELIGGWGYWATYRWVTTEYILGKGSANNNYTGGGNVSTFNDIDYCHKVITELYNKYDKKINTYMVAFTESANSSVMEELAAVAGGVYKGANNAVELNDVYNDIAKDIIRQFTITNGVFEDQLPKGITITGVEGMDSYEILGQKISIDLPPIEYKLNATETEYVADPIVFSVRLKGKTAGNYIIGLDEDGNRTSKFIYQDLDGSTKTEYFNPLLVSIGSFDAPTIELVSKTKVGEEMKATIRIYVPEGAQKVDFYRVNSDGRRYGSTTYGKYLIGDEDYVEFTDIKFSMYEDYYIKAVAVSKYDSELTSESAPTQIHKKININ